MHEIIYINWYFHSWDRAHYRVTCHIVHAHVYRNMITNAATSEINGLLTNQDYILCLSILCLNLRDYTML